MRVIKEEKIMKCPVCGSYQIYEVNTFNTYKLNKFVETNSGEKDFASSCGYQRDTKIIMFDCELGCRFTINLATSKGQTFTETICYRTKDEYKKECQLKKEREAKELTFPKK